MREAKRLREAKLAREKAQRLLEANLLREETQRLRERDAQWQQWLKKEGLSDTLKSRDELWSRFLEAQRLQELQRRQEFQRLQESQRAAQEAQQEITKLLLEKQQHLSVEERLFNAKHGII